LGGRRLVDKERAEAAVGLVHDVGADPADVRGHLLVADLLRPRCRGLQSLRGPPAARAPDDVQVHRSSFLSLWAVRPWVITSTTVRAVSEYTTVRANLSRK